MSDHDHASHPNAPAGFTPVDPPATLRHSGPGVASFALSLVLFVALIAGLIMMGVSVVNEMGADRLEEILNEAGSGAAVDEEEFREAFSAIAPYVYFYVVLLFLVVAGLVLGIVGAARKERKKVFPVLGIVFNALLLLPMVLMLIFTVSVASAA